VQRSRGDALLHVAVEFGADRVGRIAGIDERGIGDDAAEPVFQCFQALDGGDQRLALPRRHGSKPAFEIFFETGAVTIGRSEVTLEFGAVEARIEVVEVPFRQCAELGRFGGLFC
jgi:hypothetical protein